MAARTSWITWTDGIFGAIFDGTALLMLPCLGRYALPNSYSAMRLIRCAQIAPPAGDGGARD
jgi:hypothetical protein